MRVESAVVSAHSNRGLRQIITIVQKGKVACRIDTTQSIMLIRSLASAAAIAARIRSRSSGEQSCTRFGLRSQRNLLASSCTKTAMHARDRITTARALHTDDDASAGYDEVATPKPENLDSNP